MTDLAQLTLAQTAEDVREGRITPVELTEACLERVAKFEDEVRAWAYLDRDHALAQAGRALDEIRLGRTLGPLHGIPIGVKDVLDTDDMPTEYGSPVFAGHAPPRDATAVAQLRQAGAIVLGKTVTTELAVYTAGKTRNPHDLERTPGGSSSGSAAAVAAFMVPGAIGTQTNGSVIRPAAYCGVYGFKPSFGRISRHGVLRQAPSVDTVGVFARTVEDCALLAENVMFYDARDPAMSPRPRPALLATTRTEPPFPPRFAMVETPAWEQAEEETRAGLAEIAEALGELASAVDLPEPFDHAVAWHQAVMEAEIARNYAPICDKAESQLSPLLRELIERGRRIPATQYLKALEAPARLNEFLEPAFEWVDAFITPAVTGPAPKGLESTGSPVFCTIWTLLGMPAITLPLLHSESGMPIGVQLVGQRGEDAKLLRTARWLANFLAED